jgi:hypothetical protein
MHPIALNSKSNIFSNDLNVDYRPGSKKSKFDMTLISNSVFNQ